MVMSIAGIVFNKERWMISDFLILASDGRLSPLAVDVFLHRLVGFLGISGGLGLALVGMTVGFKTGMISVSVDVVEEVVMMVVTALVDCFSSLSAGIVFKASITAFGDFGTSDFTSRKRKRTTC